MRKSAAQPIGDVLKDIVEKLDQKKKKGITRIFSLWPAIAGRELSRHTRPVSLRKGTLQVLVDDSAWFYQANLKKDKLFKALQKKIDIKAEKIQKIQFRIGRIN